MIETLENAIAMGSDPFTGQTVAPAGKVSMWCAVEGGDPMGNPVAEQIIQRGIPFGHGSNKVIRGIEYAMAKDGNKTKRNSFKGPSGREYVELQIDEADMKAKQAWEGAVSNDAVKNAQGSSPSKNIDPNDPEISTKVTTFTDEIKRISDDEIDALAEKRLRTLTAEHP